MLANNLLAKEYSRRGESAFNVEIKIRTHFTKGQPAGPRMHVHKNERAR